jgi:hypothetical protein
MDTFRDSFILNALSALTTIVSYLGPKRQMYLAHGSMRSFALGVTVHFVGYVTVLLLYAWYRHSTSILGLLAVTSLVFVISACIEVLKMRRGDSV